MKYKPPQPQSYSAETAALITQLKERIKRLEDSYAAKDAQLSNLLHICRANGIDVSSQDLIHGKEAKL